MSKKNKRAIPPFATIPLSAYRTHDDLLLAIEQGRFFDLFGGFKIDALYDVVCPACGAMLTRGEYRAACKDCKVCKGLPSRAAIAEKEMERYLVETEHTPEELERIIRLLAPGYWRSEYRNRWRTLTEVS